MRPQNKSTQIVFCKIQYYYSALILLERQPEVYSRIQCESVLGGEYMVLLSALWGFVLADSRFILLPAGGGERSVTIVTAGWR